MLKCLLGLFLILILLSNINSLHSEMDLKERLKVNLNNPHHFKKISDGHYEGIYIREVSSWVLAMASLTTQTNAVHFNEMKELELQWRYPDDGQLNIYVENLRPKPPYRVELEKQLSERRFIWKLDFPSFYSLGMEQLGILGYFKGEINGKPREIHLPITFPSIPGKLSVLPNYSFKFIIPEQVNKVFYTLGFLGKDGNASVVIIDENKKIENKVSSGNVYEILIPNSKLATGYYFVDFSFKFNSNKDLPCECFFYHVKSD